MERFHHLDHGDIRAIVDEVVIRLGGVGPTPCVGERVKLCLAYFTGCFAKKNVVVRVRVKRRIEINKIDTRIRKLFPVPQSSEVVAEIQTIH